MEETTPKTVDGSGEMTENQKWDEVMALMKNLKLGGDDKNNGDLKEQLLKKMLNEDPDLMENMDEKLEDMMEKVKKMKNASIPKEQRKHLKMLGDMAKMLGDGDEEDLADANADERSKRKVMKNWSDATSLEKILHPRAAAAVYSEEGKFDEAYGILSKPMQMDEKVSFLPTLIDYYKSLINIRRHREARDIKNEFIETLKLIVQPSPKECELLGDSYRSQKEHIKAILLYQTSEALYTGETETDEMINCMQGCALGLKLSVAALVKERPDLRTIVTKDVVPAMRRVYTKLSNMLAASGEKMVCIRSLCLHHIETTELIAEDNSVRETTLREAIELMDQELGDRANKFHVYSAHVNNLAVTCMTQERPEEAIELFQKAIVCRNSAQDYDTQAEKENDLKMSRGGLQKAHEMLAYMR